MFFDCVLVVPSVFRSVRIAFFREPRATLDLWAHWNRKFVGLRHVYRLLPPLLYQQDYEVDVLCLFGL